MIGVVFHPSAEQELIEAVKFYEMHAAGLGNDFVREVENMLAQIVGNRESGNIFTGTIRRRLVPLFPLAILHQAGAKSVSVAALMHLRRRSRLLEKAAARQ